MECDALKTKIAGIWDIARQAEDFFGASGTVYLKLVSAPRHRLATPRDSFLCAL
jgi:hypothetical protein